MKFKLTIPAADQSQAINVSVTSDMSQPVTIEWIAAAYNEQGGLEWKKSGVCNAFGCMSSASSPLGCVPQGRVGQEKDAKFYGVWVNVAIKMTGKMENVYVDDEDDEIFFDHE